MKEAFQYFLVADGIEISAYKWLMSGVFTFLLLYFFIIIWKSKFKAINILIWLLIFVVFFRSAYIFIMSDVTPETTLRLLFLLFPMAMAVLIYFIYTSYSNLPQTQIAIGSIILTVTLLNIVSGGALFPDSPHWWDHNYSLIILNQAWLLTAIFYSLYIVFKKNKSSKTYIVFIRIINVSFIFYLLGHLIYTLNTSMETYWILRYLGFVSDIILVYAFGYLTWRLYRVLGRIPFGEGIDTTRINIYSIMDEISSDRFINYLEVNHATSIPKNVQKLTPRQQLHAILMFYNVSIKESAEYTFITSEAVKVYRSRIRKKLH